MSNRVNVKNGNVELIILKRTAIKRGTKPMARKKKLGKSQRPDAIAKRVCDYMWGTIVILRDKWCQYHLPIKQPATVGHHVFAKGECPATRYDLRIGMGLCGGCHEFRAHSNPEAYRDINIRHLGGQDVYDRLFALSQMRTTKPDLKLIELMLWQDLAGYGVLRPDLWDTWKEWKKEQYLREKRRANER